MKRAQRGRPPRRGHLPRHDFGIVDEASPADLAATVHRLIVHAEGEAPGCYQITCSCGARTWTPWGEDHAGRIAEQHLEAMGVKWAEVSKVRVR